MVDLKIRSFGNVLFVHIKHKRCNFVLLAMERLALVLCIVIPIQLSAQKKVEVVKFADLQKKIRYTEAPLTIFNFWSTWCGPCVKELPYFDNLENQNENVKVYLVSIDFQSELERVGKFVAKKSLKSDVLFLDEKDSDDYMDKVSQDWSGAIPATLFITDLGEAYFHEKAFTKEELKKTVEKYLN